MLKTPHATDWIAYILVVNIAMIAILRHYFPRRFLAFFKVPVNPSYFTEFAHQKEQPFWFGVILEAIMLISISLFIYIVIYIAGGKSIQHNDYVLFIKILLVALLFITLQRLFHSVTGYLFNMPKSLTLWMHAKDTFLRWVAVWITLLNLIIVFGSISHDNLLIVGISLLTLGYIIGAIRGSSLLTGSKTLSTTHIIFYLCTLEILPIIVMVKMII